MKEPVLLEKMQDMLEFAPLNNKWEYVARTNAS